MKIAEISIRLEPSIHEKNLEPITLRRDLEKIWIIIDAKGYERGLLPHEIKLANMLQEQIISVWSS